MVHGKVIEAIQYVQKVEQYDREMANPTCYMSVQSTRHAS